MRKTNPVVLNAASNTSQTSGKIDSNQLIAVSFLANFTNGDEAGTVKIQASNDPITDGYQPATFTPTNWVDVPNATATITAGGSGLITISQICYRWLRVVYTRTGGGAANKKVNVTMFALGM